MSAQLAMMIRFELRSSWVNSQCIKWVPFSSCGFSLTLNCHGDRIAALPNVVFMAGKKYKPHAVKQTMETVQLHISRADIHIGQVGLLAGYIFLWSWPQ